MIMVLICPIFLTMNHFDYDRLSAILMSPDETLCALGLSLDDWFQNKHRGRGTRVSVYERDGFFWFLIRHGEPFKREGSLRGEESDCVLYRPEKYDVVVYNPAYGELRINAPTPKIRDLYKDRFGLHLFNNSAFFPGTGNFFGQFSNHWKLFRAVFQPLETSGRRFPMIGNIRETSKMQEFGVREQRGTRRPRVVICRQRGTRRRHHTACAK